MAQKKTKKLTPRQWRLYNYLKEEYEKDHKKHVTTNDILDNLRTDYYYLKYEMENGTPLHDCVCQANIRADINALRNSSQIDKIIFSSCRGYKIATEDEANRLLHRWMTEACKKLKMYWKNKRSAECNNQLRLVFNKEKDTIRVFSE